MNDKDNLAVQVFPLSLVLGIIVSWFAVVCYSFITLKAFIRAFVLKYGSVLVPNFLPWIIPILCLFIFFNFFLTRRKVKSKSSISFVCIIFEFVLIICLCLANMLILMYKTPHDFDISANIYSVFFHKLSSPIYFQCLVAFFAIPISLYLNLYYLKQKYCSFKVILSVKFLLVFVISSTLSIFLKSMSFDFTFWIPVVLCMNIYNVMEIRKKLREKTL